MNMMISIRRDLSNHFRISVAINVSIRISINISICFSITISIAMRITTRKSINIHIYTSKWNISIIFNAIEI